jgi:hypothetical protein
MVASIKGAIFRSVSIGMSSLPPGIFTQQFSSLAPPGPQLPITGLSFTQITPPPGPYEFYDPFDNEVGYPIIDTRLINGIVGGTTVTLPLNYPSGYVWTDTIGGASDTVSGGLATVVTGTAPEPATYAAQEYNMPTGIFFEFKFNAPSLASAVVLGINLGFTGLSVVAGPDGSSSPDINGFYPARINAGGFNGYYGAGGYNYTDGVYTGVSLTNGSGGGAVADITILGGSVTSVNVTNGGSGYVATDILTANTAAIGGGSGSLFGFQVNSVDGFGVILTGLITTGTPLQANPLDMWDTASASFSTDAYYTSVNQDWRNVVIRAEMTPTQMNLYADGVLIVQQTLRFTTQLFGSDSFTKGTANYGWSSGAGSLSVFSSGSPDPITLDYVQVGSL